jgi:Domain of unknown function (DUF4326)
MHSVTVVHRNEAKWHNSDICCIECDRNSLLGNPFPMKGEAQRMRVCDAYDDYFDLVMAGVDPVQAIYVVGKKYGLPRASAWRVCTRLEWLKAFRDVVVTAQEISVELICWCAPKRCHCDRIKRAVELALSVVV